MSKDITAADASKSATFTLADERYTPDQLYPNFNISFLNPDPDNPRKGYDEAELDGLAMSIAKIGVVEPVLCRQDNEGYVFIVAGWRRFLASLKAGKTDIPVIFKAGETTEMSLVENILRSDLTPVEEAEAYQRLKGELGYKSKQLAALVGKSEPTVSQILSITSLPTEIKDEIRKVKTYTRAELLDIVGKGKSETVMLASFKKLKDLRSGAPKVKADGSAALLKQSDDLIKKLTPVDLSSLNPENAASLSDSLTNLANLIVSKVAK